ncbi:T9SS type A sorting domain-containing protein [Flavobacterium sp. SUN046]|uniref:T9SS type A sorting domain-containing protein n=1 Tax=Flavobacterium sp. SUN046 TaxID=3002440 RepID=UPI002DB7FC58|nr:T9SS type A sorting domain-containing protein [Flavobacterium sp. SUN046]MEC4049907.1 T9SS type A sorting domain-containing protein [Flavobacterium sp. SUN046]
MKKIILLIFLMITSLGFSQGTAPTAPARNASDVISVFCGAYSDIGSDFFPNWGQGTSYEQVALGGDLALHYSNLDYQGVQFNAPINASTMTKLHIDVWTPNLSPFNVYLIAGGESAVTLYPTLSGWNSFDIDLTQYSNAGRTMDNIIQFKFEKPNFAYHAETNSIYLDNIYFWKPANVPTLSNFSIAPKTVASAPFTIVAPTSTSSGAFTYTSSNTSVATVSGSTITVTGVGSTVITATQTAAGGFSSGSISATLEVTPTAAASPTISFKKIIALYTDSYQELDVFATVDTFATSWSAATLSSVAMGANNALKYSFLNYVGIETTSNPVNASGMNFFHLDLYTTNITTFRVKLVDFGADGAYGGGDDKEHEVSLTPTLNGWNSLNLLLSDFTGLTTRSHIAQIIFSCNPAGSGVAYIDNIYFGNQAVSSAPALSNFTIPAKVTGDADFVITAPTTNSAGAFSYTSSNTAVATIVNGNSIHVVGEGSTTITATQAASGSYTAGTITTTLVVTAPLPQTPTAAAPTPPSRNAWDVKSVYSGAYTAISNVELFPDWGQGTSFTEVQLGSNSDNTIKYSNLDYEGLNLVSGGAAPGASFLGMTKLHIDVWTPNVSPFLFSLIDATGENSITLTPTLSGWNSFDIVLSSDFPARNLATLRQMKFEKPGFAYHAENNSIYFDNIYFWRPTTSLPSPVITNFNVSSKLLGDAAFNLTAPSSNSTGAFSYTSSNTDVATISGSTVTIVGAGVSVITATQAATASYGSGTIVANLVVSYPPPATAAPTPTIPADRVLSLYSNAYTNVAGTDWFPNWGQSTQVSDVQISGNDTKKYEFLNYQGVQLASAIDVSSMTTLHVDIWTPNCTTFEVNLINSGASTTQQSVSLSPVNSGWNSFDIPLSQYNTINLSSVNQLMFVATPSGSTTAYLDNIYFAKPTPTVVAPTVAPIVNLCKGTAVTPLTAPVHAGNTLKWYTVGGTVAVPTYTFIATGAPSPATSTVASPSKTYAVSEVFSNGVESPKSRITVNVLALPTTPTTLTGTAAQGPLVGTTTTATYGTTAVVGATSYLWSVPTGVSIVSGQGTTTLVVDFNNVPAGVGSIGAITVKAVNDNGCASIAKSLTLTKALPAAPASIKMTDGVSLTAITSFAKFMGTTKVMTLTAAPSLTATSYEWELPTGVTKLSGGNSNVITVNFLGVTYDNTLTAIGTNVLRIGVKSRNGVGVSITNNAALINPSTTSTAKLLVLTAVKPAAASAVTGQIVGLCGGNTYSYTITDTALASSYTVTAPAGAIVTFTSNLTFNVTYPVGFLINTTTALANKTLVITSVNGIGSSVASKSLTLSTAMAAISAVVGGTTYSNCNQTFSVAAAVGATSYTWTVPAGATIVSGQGTNSVVVNYNALTGNQTIKVSAANACGTSSAIKSVTLTLGSCPTTREENTSLTSFDMTIYPNPASSEFNIELDSAFEGQAELSVYSITGAFVSSRNIQLIEGNNVINENISTLSSGVYFVKLTNASNNQSVIKKLIKE